MLLSICFFHINLFFYTFFKFIWHIFFNIHWILNIIIKILIWLLKILAHSINFYFVLIFLKIFLNQTVFEIFFELSDLVQINLVAWKVMSFILFIRIIAEIAINGWIWIWCAFWVCWVASRSLSTLSLKWHENILILILSLKYYCLTQSIVYVYLNFFFFFFVRRFSDSWHFCLLFLFDFLFKYFYWMQ